MSERRITQIPVPGSSGQTPTGAMQFHNDWPGLFVRGDDAIMLMAAIERLQVRLAAHPDMVVVSALNRLSGYTEIIARDVIVGRGQEAEQAAPPDRGGDRCHTNPEPLFDAP